MAYRFIAARSSSLVRWRLVIKRCVRLLLVAALLGSAGAHLAVLQTFAWAKMTADFSRGDTMGRSVQKALDGRHPCGLCLTLKRASQNGASLETAAPGGRLELSSPSSAPRPARTEIAWALPVPSAFHQERVLPPDSPPPKEIHS